MPKCDTIVYLHSLLHTHIALKQLTLWDLKAKTGQLNLSNQRVWLLEVVPVCVNIVQIGAFCPLCSGKTKRDRTAGSSFWFLKGILLLFVPDIVIIFNFMLCIYGRHYAASMVIINLYTYISFPIHLGL